MILRYVVSILFFAAMVGSTTEEQKGFFSGMKRTMMTLQNPTLSTHLFTGSRNVCGKPGKGGERCVPFGKMAKSDFALSVLFLNCCRMCPEKFAQKLLLLDISIHIQKKLQRRFNKVVKKRHERKERRERRRSSADSSFVETEEQFDVNSLFYGDGDQITESLPCCDVCPEQFYAPEDYDDISDPIGDPPSSMFIETKMKEKMKEKVNENKKEKEKEKEKEKKEKEEEKEKEEKRSRRGTTARRTACARSAPRRSSGRATTFRPPRRAWGGSGSCGWRRSAAGRPRAAGRWRASAPRRRSARSSSRPGRRRKAPTSATFASTSPK
jgi:hypothetical protein